VRVLLSQIVSRFLQHALVTERPVTGLQLPDAAGITGIGHRTPPYGASLT